MVYGEPVVLGTQGGPSTLERVRRPAHPHDMTRCHLVPQLAGRWIATSSAPPWKGPPGGMIRFYARPAANRFSPPRIPRGTRLLVRGDGDRLDGGRRPAALEPRVLPRRRSRSLAPGAVEQRAGAQCRRHHRRAVRRDVAAAPRLRRLGGAPADAPPGLGDLLAAQRPGALPLV